jgi:hypothetical protein
VPETTPTCAIIKRFSGQKDLSASNTLPYPPGAPQLLRQVDHGDRGIISGIKKERDRETLRASRRSDHIMHVGAHEAVRGQFQKLASVDAEGFGNGRRLAQVDNESVALLFAAMEQGKLE